MSTEKLKQEYLTAHKQDKSLKILFCVRKFDEQVKYQTLGVKKGLRLTICTTTQTAHQSGILASIRTVTSTKSEQHQRFIKNHVKSIFLHAIPQQ